VSEKGDVRRLAAILVVDAAGYSEMMRIDETSTHRQIKSDIGTIFAPMTQAHRGRVVKTTGDGLHAEFASIVDCVQCATAMQQGVAKRKTGLPEAAPLLYRIGINLGDIIVEPDDIYGDGVNVAVRLQGLAEPGEILLSGDAHRQVAGKVKVAFDDLGHHRVKHIAEPIHVFRVPYEGAPLAEGRRRSSAPPAQPQPAAAAIAVMPFDNLSDAADQGYFSDGLTNDIITDLSKFSELFVIASHTAAAYKAKSPALDTLGRDLGVTYVVQGSVQRGGDRIRINVKLAETATGRHLWAERYDRKAQDLFQVQDEIVQMIVGTLVARVSISERMRALHQKPENLKAYDFYLRGRAAFQGWAADTNKQAREFFTKAIELDPFFALAYGYLAYSYVQAWLGGWERSPATLKRARDLAHQAVVLGPSDYDNQWSLGVAYIYSREFEKGMAAFERAIELCPNGPDLLADMADALVYVGRPEEAVANIHRAMRLNLIHPDSYLWSLGVALYHCGRYEEALSALMRMNQPPNLVRRHVAANLVRLGRMEEARQMATEFLKNDPDYRLERETVWPHKNPNDLDDFITDLRRAGLPD
jgi:TolB-like protein/class 3 adenylate cyclase/Tfp pilus assembly protein PilF